MVAASIALRPVRHGRCWDGPVSPSRVSLWFRRSRVERLAKEIAALEEKLADTRQRASASRSSALRASGSISKATSASTAQSKLRDARRQADAEKPLDKVAFLYSHLPPWKPEATVNLRSIRFPSLGSAIEALPTTENVGRSRTAALVVLDEHAHQPHARRILLAVKAVAEQGQLLSISSANGHGALHSQIYLAAKARTNGWQAVSIPAQAHPDRRAPGWRERERAALGQLSDAAFAQEYPESHLEAIQTTGRPVFRRRTSSASRSRKASPARRVSPPIVRRSPARST